MNNQFETTLFLYGYLEDGTILSRATVQKMAQILVGTESRYFEGHAGTLACIVSYRFEDDSPSDRSKGRVIATCEPVQVIGPYKPQGMETK